MRCGRDGKEKIKYMGSKIRGGYGCNVHFDSFLFIFFFVLHFFARCADD